MKKKKQNRYKTETVLDISNVYWIMNSGIPLMECIDPFHLIDFRWLLLEDYNKFARYSPMQYADQGRN